MHCNLLEHIVGEPRRKGAQPSLILKAGEKRAARGSAAAPGRPSSLRPGASRRGHCGAKGACRHLLPAALCVPDPPGRPWPSGGQRELIPALCLPRSLPPPLSLPLMLFLSSPAPFRDARVQPIRKILICILGPFLLLFAPQLKSSVSSVSPKVTLEA